MAGDSRARLINVRNHESSSMPLGDITSQSAAGHGRLTLLQAAVKNGGITVDPDAVLA